MPVDAHSGKRLVARSAASAAALLAVLALVGWAADLPRLRSVADGLVSMNPMTAVALLLAAAAVACSTVANRSAAVAGGVCGGAVAFFGLAKLATYATGLDLGLDRMLFPQRVAVVVASFPNRMALGTAVALLLLGAALVLFAAARRYGLGQALAALTALVALQTFVDYLFHFRAPGLGSAIPMALNTSAALLLLSGALLVSTDRSGWMAVFADEGPAGIGARRLLPAVVLVPVVLGWLRLHGERSGLYDNEHGVSLMVIGNIAALGAIVWWNARRIEIADLRRKLAEAEVRRSERMLQETNVELARRVEELHSVNRELEAFSYSVSHDLRAPLRSIDGFSQVLQEDCAGRLGADADDSIRRIRAAAGRMGQLIDDMLRLSRISRVELRSERVDLSEMARRIVAELASREPERRVETGIEENLVVEGDRQLLGLAMENLLANAFKFTSKRPDARIEFGRGKNGGAPCYTVRDNGAGFDMAHAERLFGAFQRLHAATDFAGTGIGLATVQRVIHRHGGRIWAEAAVGEGAAFSFSLSGAEEARPIEPGART